MAQRDVLLQAINLLNTLRGPAKIYYATSNQAMPTVLQAAISVTSGAPVAPWVAFGCTRGGINVSKNLDITVRDDIDQIQGAYDQDITDENWVLTTQMAEVLDRAQLAETMDLGTPSVVAATATLGTQYMVPLSGGDLKTTERRWLIVYPKSDTGKAIGFVFRRGAVSGGEKAFRFDKTDPASPPLEIRMFPEIATSIPAEDSFGRLYEID